MENILTRKNNILVLIFAILTILQCQTVYVSNSVGQIIVNLLWQAILFLIFVLSLIGINISKDTRLITFIFIYGLISITLLTLLYIYSPYTPFYFLLLFLDPIMLVTVFYSCVKDNHFDIYFFMVLEKIILILSVISILFWIFMLLGFNPNVYVTIKWGGIRLIGGFFYVHFMPQDGIFNFLGLQLHRNTGVFVEAPIYSFILSCALIIELFIRKAKKTFNYRTILLIITIFTTTSTTGIIAAIISISIYLFINNRNVIQRLMLITLSPIIYFVLKVVFLNKVNSAGSSYGIRQQEWNSDLFFWKQHILIGNGLPNISGNGGISSFGNIGLSSGLMASLAYGGIVMASFYILPCILSIFSKPNLKSISIILIFLFTLTIVFNMYLFIVFISMLWVFLIYPKIDFNSKNII